MNLQDIRARLAVSRNQSLLADLSPVDRYPGFVRSTHLRAPHRVIIEYEPFNEDAGGAYFHADYASLQAAIDAITAFTGMPPGDWGIAKDFDHPPAVAEIQAGHDRLAADISAGCVDLPEGADFELRGSYWKRFERMAGG